MRGVGEIVFLVTALTQSPYPFEPGEHLVYEVSYYGITAGYITLDYTGTKEMDGKVVLEFTGIAETSKFFSTFYRVKDVIYLYMDSESFKPIKVVLDLNEGKRKREEQIIYDFGRNECRYYKKNKEYVTSITPDTQDSFASLYFYRIISRDNGNFVSFNVYGSRKVWTLEATAVKKETLKTPVGEFDSIVVRPRTRFEGILQEKGNVYMWFTDDEKRLPLKFEAKIKLGTLQGVLVEYKLRENDKKITSQE